MPALPIRSDISPDQLRRRARREGDGRVCARLLAIANALDGLSRAEAARRAGMDRQTLRDWVIRYNAEGVTGLRDRPRSGRPPRLSAGEQAALKAAILRGPDPERDGIAEFRLKDIQGLIARRYGVGYSSGGTHRLIKSLNLSQQTVRPVHPQADRAAQAGFKKTSPAS
jgi:transposase